MNLNIIGDIHGRDSWKQLVDKNSINVFVGDYFDPYERIEFEQMKTNFNEIIKFKIDNPNTILLLGNHDCHYLYPDDGIYSRYNFESAKEINKLLDTHKDKFQIAYFNKDHNTIITHAGISKTWYKNWFGELDDNPQTICDNINYLFKENHKAFSFECCQYNIFDMYGIDKSQSPMWIRPQALIEDLIDNVKQVVGHTQVIKIATINNLTL